MDERRKYDVRAVLEDVKKSFKNERISSRLGTGDELRELSDDDYIKLGQWWQEPTNLPGLPLGRITTISGPSDTGKTSLAIEAMKAAQDQGVAVIYTETENKTTKGDLENWGVDSSQVMMIHSQIAEELFEMLLRTWDSFKRKNPDAPLFVIIDSIGNLLSLRDESIDMLEQSSTPGGKGKSNRIGISKIVSRVSRDNAGVLLISYTYSNIGSVGEVTAGGRALHLYSSLMYQTQRVGWYDRTVDGRKIRAGAEVLYKLQKNHLNKLNPGASKIKFRITKDGFTCLEKKLREDDEEESE